MSDYYPHESEFGKVLYIDGRGRSTAIAEQTHKFYSPFGREDRMKAKEALRGAVEDFFIYWVFSTDPDQDDIPDEALDRAFDFWADMNDTTRRKANILFTALESFRNDSRYSGVVDTEDIEAHSILCVDLFNQGRYHECLDKLLDFNTEQRLERKSMVFKCMMKILAEVYR